MRMNTIKTFQYQIYLKLFQWFMSCFMHTDRRTTQRVLNAAVKFGNEENNAYQVVGQAEKQKAEKNTTL
jgi:hypothetical protein